jgi:hypothetical protein
MQSYATTSYPEAFFLTISCPITGTPRRLSELQGDDPLILTVARGHYAQCASLQAVYRRYPRLSPR